ncbi:MAG: MBL fold metallo-hydrolase [Chloroflexi bacterium]|nr:MBL fold metallo-hydrolase [Chloroflexota bacterium]
MHIETIPVGPLQANCYLVQPTGKSRAWVIDPGGDAALLLRTLKKMGADVEAILCTHGHWDHVAAAPELSQATGAGVALHRDELSLFKAGGGASWFGLPTSQYPDPQTLLAEGDSLTLGEVTFTVWHTPGHSPGSVCFYSAAQGVLFNGDLLFQEGIGRSDLPGGSPQLLKASLQRVLTLPDATRVFSGHGSETTIGHERQHNPWLADGFWW